MTPPAAIAPQPRVVPAALSEQRVQARKKPQAAKPQARRTKVRQPKLTLGAPDRVGTAVDSSPQGMLLAGGLALFVLLVGETIFLSLSVRFLRRVT